MIYAEFRHADTTADPMLPNSSEPEGNSSHCPPSHRFLVIPLTPDSCREFVITSKAEALIAREIQPEFWLFPPRQHHTPSWVALRCKTELWVRAIAQCNSTVRACYAMAQTNCIRCGALVYSVSLTWHLIYECPKRRTEIVHPWAGPPTGAPLEYWEKD